MLFVENHTLDCHVDYSLLLFQAKTDKYPMCAEEIKSSA